LVKKGVVKEVHGDQVRVQVYKKNSCGNCKTCTEGGRYSEELDIKTNKKFEVGDIVSFEINDGSIINMGILVYILPILMFFSGYSAASFFRVTEGLKIAASFFSMASCFAVVHVFDKFCGKKFLDKNIRIRI
jgi:sigma-E factor negative regulatory protein RseC